MNPGSLEKLFAALNAAGVRYLVVGGLAILAHGYLRMTRDLDLEELDRLNKSNESGEDS